jgi:hypothetical protein
MKSDRSRGRRRTEVQAVTQSEPVGIRRAVEHFQWRHWIVIVISLLEMMFFLLISVSHDSMLQHLFPEHGNSSSSETLALVMFDSF